jgi:hypothetical protein
MIRVKVFFLGNFSSIKSHLVASLRLSNDFSEKWPQFTINILNVATKPHFPTKLHFYPPIWRYTAKKTVRMDIADGPYSARHFSNLVA